MAALDMRKRVKQWQPALDLAYALEPSQVPHLSHQRALVIAVMFPCAAKLACVKTATYDEVLSLHF